MKTQRFTNLAKEKGNCGGQNEQSNETGTNTRKAKNSQQRQTYSQVTI